MTWPLQDIFVTAELLVCLNLSLFQFISGFVSTYKWRAALLVDWYHRDDENIWLGTSRKCSQGIPKHIS